MWFNNSLEIESFVESRGQIGVATNKISPYVWTIKWFCFLVLISIFKIYACHGPINQMEAGLSNKDAETIAGNSHTWMGITV